MENSSAPFSVTVNGSIKRVFSPVFGAICLLQGLRLLFTPGLRRFLFVPLTINILVFILLAWIGFTRYELVVEKFLPETSWLGYFRWLVWPLFVLALLLLFFYAFTFVANLLAAPFNGLLAAKVEQLLTENTPSKSVEYWAAEVMHGLFSELRKLIYYLIRAIPFLLLFLIPVIQLAAPVFWIIFNAWFFALEYLDYPMSNHGLSFQEQIKLNRKSSLPVLGFGAAVGLLMLVPVLNFAVMPAAVAGATIFWCRSPEYADKHLSQDH